MHHVIYLSGPMTGIPDFNYPAFDAATAKLRALGYTVLNPAEDFDADTELDYEEYIRKDIKHVLNATLLVLLPGWEESAGSHLEVAIAVGIGMPVALIEDVLVDEGEDITFIFNPHEGRRSLARLFGLAEQQESTDSILDEAHELVHGDRGEDYGHPLDDFSKTALIWSAIFGIPVEPEQVALGMIGVKMSREINKAKRDNRVDGAGYFETLDMVVNERARRAQVTREAL
jgi:hypothetical protein